LVLRALPFKEIAFFAAAAFAEASLGTTFLEASGFMRRLDKSDADIVFKTLIRSGWVSHLGKTFRENLVPKNFNQCHYYLLLKATETQ